MDLSATRVVDPILTNVARGYKNAMFVFAYIFPIVSVMARGGKVIAFGAEHFVQRNIERAPGAETQRLEIGYKGDPYALVQRALEGVVPKERVEEAQNVPGINLQRMTTNRTMDNVMLQIEIASADIALDSGQYSAEHTAALAGAAQWSHDDSNPAKAINDRKEQIANAIGMRPNTMVVSPDVHDALVNHPDVIDRVKHVTGLKQVQVGVDELANYFMVQHYVVGYSRKGDADGFTPVWGNGKVWLGYTAVSSLAGAEGDMGEPSFGYCYRLDGYPIVEETYWEKRSKSWVIPVTCEDEPVIAGKDAGYLLTDVVEV